MHSRIRFILNLLPLLQNATSLRRIVSVLAATLEGAIDINNIPGEGFPLRKWRNQVSSIETLLLQEAAGRAPDVSFIHTVPGVVKGGIMRDAEGGFGLTAVIALSNLLMPMIQTPPKECGERHLFVATSAMYAPSGGAAVPVGVPLDGTLAVARGSNGEMGSGMYSVDNKGESAGPKVEKLLAEFRDNGTANRVWHYISMDFERITGTEAAP
jgi:hypothetical protein